MNFKKIVVLLILSLVIFSTVNTIYAEDRDYYINNALIDLTVHENGMLHVNESYTYSFDGTFSGVYRDIPIKDGQDVRNVKVYIDGAYGDYKVINKGDYIRIIVYLWSDASHTQKIHDTDVKITYEYNRTNVVTLYNDVGSLQYKLWGENWDCRVQKLTANIHLPGNNSYSYYLNPEYYNLTDSTDGNTIHIETSRIPSGKFYELQVLMPLSDFQNASYANHQNIDGKDEILKHQAEYKSNVNFWGNLYDIIAIICFISPASLIFVYLKYGREPKVNYEGIYERELPTDDPPEVVNALIEHKSNIGKPDMKGFEASIMDLIDRKVFKIHVEEEQHTKDLILEFDESKYESLSKPEKTIFTTLEHFSQNGVLNVSGLSSQLNNEYNGKYFKGKLDAWEEDVINEYSVDEKVEKYFNDTGSNLGIAFLLGGFFTAIVTIILFACSSHPNSWHMLIGGIFLAAASIGVMFLPNDILGQWTPEGRVYYLKWRNFKKFLSDNSLINEHPPESIVIWNKYLVYGTALGVADEVYKAMKLNAPSTYDDDYYYYSDIYRFHSYAGLAMMHSAFDTGISAANPSSGSGGIGNVGGGSGGGGGGAF